MDNIKNKVAIVTGGATGLGYTYVQHLLENGAKGVAILDLSTSAGKTTAETFGKEFGKERVLFVPCDVTNAETLKSSYEKTIDTFKGLDIVINNAGILNDKNWGKCIDINIKALIGSSLTAVDYMGTHKGGKGGTVVNISSIAGLSYFANAPVYTATKYAVIGFSGAMHKNYEWTGVRFLTMCPGVTETVLIQNCTERLLDFVDPEYAEKLISSLPKQKPEDVAQAMINLIQKGKSGAVWVCEDKKTYSVDFPKYQDILVPV